MTSKKNNKINLILTKGWTGRKKITLYGYTSVVQRLIENKATVKASDGVYYNLGNYDTITLVEIL